MNTFAGAMTGLLLAATLAGCGGESEIEGPSDAGSVSVEQEPTAEQEATVEKNARYETVEELRDAAVVAGYGCTQWVQTDRVGNAEESGSCTDEDTFAIYASSSAVNRHLRRERERSVVLAEQGIIEPSTLVGPNWTIKTDAAVELGEFLGGAIQAN